VSTAGGGVDYTQASEMMTGVPFRLILSFFFVYGCTTQGIDKKSRKYDVLLECREFKKERRAEREMGECLLGLYLQTRGF
jgi:hypothetical protein